jgi:hypothetical protein
MSTGSSFIGSEADHAPPLSAEIRNAWSYISALTFEYVCWYMYATGLLYKAASIVT